jgi:hypothetical protein
MGYKKPILERKLLLVENILPMQERATEFYQKAEGDFLEQSELGLNFLC